MGKFDSVSGKKMTVIINNGPFEGRTGQTVKAFAAAAPGAPVIWSVKVQGMEGLTFNFKHEELTFCPPSKAYSALTSGKAPAEAPKPAYIITTISSADLKAPNKIKY